MPNHVSRLVVHEHGARKYAKRRSPSKKKGQSSRLRQSQPTKLWVAIGTIQQDSSPCPSGGEGKYFLEGSLAHAGRLFRSPAFPPQFT